MRKACIMLALWAVTQVVASEPPALDRDIMLNVEDLNKSLASNIALRDAKASIADAKEIYELFGPVEAHFSQRGDAPNGVDLTRKARNLALQIVKVVGQTDFDTATNAAIDLSRTCKACHTFYRKE
jgi:hypothetical protein